MLLARLKRPGLLAILLLALIAAIAVACGPGTPARPTSTPLPARPDPEGTATRAAQMTFIAPALQIIPTPRPSPRPTDPSARVVETTIESIGMAYMEKIDGKPGLVLHVKCQVNRAESSQVRLVAFFWLIDGKPMPAQKPAYSNSAGQATVASLPLAVGAMGGKWDDIPLGMPSEAMAKGQGHYAIVQIQDVATGKALVEGQTRQFYVGQ